MVAKIAKKLTEIFKQFSATIMAQLQSDRY